MKPQHLTYVICLLAIFSAVLLAGCDDDQPPTLYYPGQESSLEEALYVVSHVVDFDRVLFYADIRIGTTNSLITSSSDEYFPVMYHPSFADSVQVQFTHLLLVAHKGNTYSVVIMDDSRPPMIVGEFPIDLDRELDYENYDF